MSGRAGRHSRTRQLQRRRHYLCTRAIRRERPGRAAAGSPFVLEGDHDLDATHIHHQRQPHGLGPTDGGGFDGEINVIGCWLCGQRSSASSKRRLRTSTPGADSEHQLQSPVPERTPHRGFGASFGGVLCASCCWLDGQRVCDEIDSVGESLGAAHTCHRRQRRGLGPTHNFDATSIRSECRRHGLGPGGVGSFGDILCTFYWRIDTQRTLRWDFGADTSGVGGTVDVARARHWRRPRGLGQVDDGGFDGHFRIVCYWLGGQHILRRSSGASSTVTLDARGGSSG